MRLCEVSGAVVCCRTAAALEQEVCRTLSCHSGVHFRPQPPAVLTKLVRSLVAILAANNGVHPASKATHEQVGGCQPAGLW